MLSVVMLSVVVPNVVMLSVVAPIKMHVYVIKNFSKLVIKVCQSKIENIKTLQKVNFTTVISIKLQKLQKLSYCLAVYICPQIWVTKSFLNVLSFLWIKLTDFLISPNQTEKL